jgi:hypothetical protein
VPILLVPPTDFKALPELGAEAMLLAVAHGAAMLGGAPVTPPTTPPNWPRAAEPWPVYYSRTRDYIQLHYELTEGGVEKRPTLTPLEFADVPCPSGCTDRKLVGHVLMALLVGKESHGEKTYHNVVKRSTAASYLSSDGWAHAVFLQA